LDILRALFADGSISENVIGVIVYGSSITKNKSPDSDIDVRIICRAIEPSNYEKIVEGSRFHVQTTPLNAILNAISNEIDWLIGQIKDCQIIYERGEIMTSLKKICNQFKFSKLSITEDIRLSEETYEYAQKFVEKEDLAACFLCIAYSSLRLGRARLKQNNLFYRGPKYLISQFQEVSINEMMLLRTIFGGSLNLLDIKKKMEALKEFIEIAKADFLQSGARTL